MHDLTNPYLIVAACMFAAHIHHDRNTAWH